MSTLVDIAEKADVAVEGVVRVLTRRPVSAAVSERVLAVLDQLDGEQAQVVERFALAAIPDVLPPEGPPSNGIPHAALVRADANVRSTGQEELVVQLGGFLQELVDSLAQLQRQGAALREDRIADLAVLVDLMSATSEGVSRRLGRLEQMVVRLEAPRR